MWKVLLFSGLAGSLGLAQGFELSDLDGLNGFAIQGQNTNEQLGKSVNGAGDVNGDGINDVVLYARGADSAFGRVYVLFGRNTAVSANFTPTFDLTLLTADLTNLNTSFGFIVDGINGDNPARSVASAGDVNNDGIDDLIIGSAENSLGPNNQPLMGNGKAYVIYGRNTAQVGFFPNTIDLRQLTATQGFILNGISAGDQAGSAVAGAGDVNGDGIDDVIVGARFADAQGRTEAGESYVVFGRNAAIDGVFPLNVQLSQLDGTNGFALSGANAGDLSGHSVTGAGDLNNDGLSDVIVGAHLADTDTVADAGAAYVVFGRNTALTGNFPARIDLRNIDGSGGFAMQGVDESDQFGRSIAGIGDFNADGIDDILIGARLANPNNIADAGRAYVVYGRNTAMSGPFPSTLALASLDGSNGFAINGINQFDRLGHAVSGAGDVDGDGIVDLLVTAPNADNSAGSTYIVFGRDTAVRGNFAPQINLGGLNERNVRFINGIKSLTLTNEGDFSGRAAGVLGDINGDNAADFIIGAPLADPLNRFDAGEAYVVFGAPLPPITTINITAGNNQTIMAGQASVPVEFQVFDANGNIVVGQPISLFASLFLRPSNPEEVTVINGVTDVFGKVSASLNAQTIAGQYEVVAELPPSNLVSARASITVIPAAPNNIRATVRQGQVIRADQTSEVLAFQLRDRFGNPVPDNQISFGVIGPGPSSQLTPPVTLTNNFGSVATQLSSATVPGEYLVSASLTSAPAITASISLQVIAGTPTQLAVIEGDAQTIAAGTASAEIRVELTDAFGNPATNSELINFGLILPDGSTPVTGLSTFSETIDANGQVVTQLDPMPLAGDYIVTAVLDSNNALTAQTAVTVTPAAPASLTLVAGDGQTILAGNPSSDISFQVADEFGNVIAGEALDFTLTGPDAQPVSDGLSVTSTTTDASGNAVVQTTATGIIGNYTVTATLTSNPALTANATLTVEPGVPAMLNLLAGGSQSVEEAQPSAAIIFQVLDAFGNVVPNQAVNFTHTLPDNSPGAGLSAATATSNDIGQVATQLLNSSPVGIHNIAATLASDTSLMAGTALRVTVPTPELPDLGQGAALDAAGAPVATDARFGAGVSIEGGPFINPSVFSVDNAVVVQGEFDVDSQHLGQTADVVVAIIRQTPAGATEILSLNALGEFEPLVDLAALPAFLSSITLFSPQSLPLFTGQLNLTGASDWFFGYRLADGTLVFNTQPLHMDITAGASTALTLLEGDAQMLTVGTTSAPLSFQLTDSFGNPVPGQTVDFSVTAPDGSIGANGLNVPQAVSDGNGVVSVQLTITQPAGTYQLTASSGELTATATLTFTSAMPSVLTINSGAAQQIPAGQPSNSIVFQVLDEFGNPVAGQTLSFQETNSGAPVTPITGITNNDGQVIARLEALTQAGVYRVEGLLAGDLMLMTAAEITVQPLAASILTLAGGNGQNVIADNDSAPITFNVTDEFGNVVANTAVNFALAPTGAGVTPATGQTDASGQVGVVMNATLELGAYTLTATLDNAPAVSVVVPINVISPPPPLVDTGSSAAVDANGMTTTTTARFSLGGSVNSGEFGSPVSMTTDDSLAIQALIEVDSAHLGMIGEFVALFLHQPINSPSQVLTLDANGQLITWDGTLANLGTFAPSQPLFTPNNLSVFNGALNLVGQVSVFVGYRLADGALIFTPSPLPITVQSGAPAQFQLVTGDGQTFTAGTNSAPLQFQLLDALGNPAADRTVDYTLTPPVGTPSAAGLNAAQTTTDPNGATAVQLIAPTMAGNYLLEAQVTDNLTLTASANLTVTAAAATSLVLNGGANQTVPAGQDAAPVRFLLTDSFGNPVPDVEVGFTVRPPIGAVTSDGLTPVSASSNEDGEAAVVLNGTGLIGNHLIRATVVATPDLTDTVRVVVEAGPAAALSIRAGNAQLVPQVVNSNPIILRVEDSFGNPVSDANVSFVLTPPNDATNNPELSITAATSNAGGEVMTQLLATDDLGDYLIEATLTAMITAQIELRVVGGLPALGTGQGTDTNGDALTTDAEFFGGASLDGDDWMTPLTVQSTDTVRLLGRIQTDTAHVGNIVELLAYVSYQPTQGDAQLFMLDTNSDLQTWDGNPSTLAAFGQAIVLPADYLLDLFNAELESSGTWTVSFGYRRENGEVIVTGNGIVVQVE